MPEIAMRNGAKIWTMPAWLVPLTNHIPPGQFARYLMVGATNTVVGYGSFALLTALLAPVISNSYILASVLSSVLNITFAFLNYKWFVFKTKGNYLREWLRCITVYGSGMVFGTMLLPVIVFVLHRLFHIGSGAPYLAGGILTCVTVIYSFLGHRKFSFRPPSQGSEIGEGGKEARC